MDVPICRPDQVDIHAGCSRGQAGPLIAQRHLGITKMRPLNLVQKSQAPASVGAGGASKLLAKLPKIHGFHAVHIAAAEIPA